MPALLEEAVGERAAAASQARVAERLRSGDATLWAPAGTPEVADRLGWLTIAERMLEGLEEILQFAGRVAAEGATDAVLLGMGGSSLAPEVMRRSFAAKASGLRLHVLDSTDAAAIQAVGRAIDPSRTIFIVSSKSGGTIEPLSLLAHFRTLAPPERFVAITDPDTKLEALAAEQGFRRTFSGDPGIGGRYSALSPFGIVPGALMGADVRSLLSGASEAWATPQQTPTTEMPTAVWLGVALGALAHAGRDKLTFVISPALPGLGLWLEQLFAESTGKQGRGILPVAEEPLLDPAAYGEDRVFAHIPDPAAPSQRSRENWMPCSRPATRS
jgi:glucose-6-phosphate isomerase